MTVKRGYKRPLDSKNKQYIPQPQFERETQTKTRNTPKIVSRGKDKEPEAFLDTIFSVSLDRDNLLTLKEALIGPDAEE